MGSDLGYAPPSSVAELEGRIEEVGRMLRGLERALDAATA
jgi:hypothetical protein